MATLPQLEELPRRTTTQVKNKWGELVRDVRALGTIAVTNHDEVEMVVLEAGKYREMAKLVASVEDRQKAALSELAAEFDRRLAVLNAPDARERIEAAMALRGRVKPRSKAGPSF